MELTTGENDKGRRLDRILRKALADVPLAVIQRLIRKGQVLVNGKRVKAQHRLDCGMKITVSLIKNSQNNPSDVCSKFSRHLLTSGSKCTGQRINRQAAMLPLPEILWQGSGLLAVNKPSGLSVHGHNSMDEMVRCFLADKLPSSLSFNPGPLHRLDKPSSGIVIFSTSIEGARLFSSLLKERKVRKTYMAIVEGNVNKEEIWKDELVRDREKKKTFVSPENESGRIVLKTNGQTGAKTAITKVTPLAANGNYTLIKAEIATGRTHQIRAQAASRGHPLAGDVKYGGRRTTDSGLVCQPAVKSEKKVSGKKREVKSISGFFLHAIKLEFLEYSIEAPVPEEFRKKITCLFP